MKNKKKVSIIIPTYNRANELMKCLESIFRQKFSDFEVIVVDDGSTDKTKKILGDGGWLRKIIYVENRINSGVSQAKNRGINKAGGDYFWFLDSDVVVKDPQCLSMLVKISQANKKMGSIGCELIERESSWKIRQHSFFGTDKTFSLKPVIKLKPIDYLATCNCFIKAALVRKIGGFNQKYFYGYEDAELGKKVADLGYWNLLDSRVSVYHFRSTGTRMANYKTFFKNRIRFCLWNFSLWNFLMLPYIDIKNFFTGVKLARKTTSYEMRGQSATKTTLLLGKVGIALEYFSGLFYGYLWNLFFLPKTLLIDKRRISYVQPV